MHLAHCQCEDSEVKNKIVIITGANVVAISRGLRKEDINGFLASNITSGINGALIPMAGRL